MKHLLLILSFFACLDTGAYPPPNYHLAFNGNFNGKGGNADGWLPISEWGPIPGYVLGNELWYPQFIGHTPDGRDFGNDVFTPSACTQGYGKMTIQPYGQPGGQWYGAIISTVDNNLNGYSVTPPFYATVYMSLPSGGTWAWPAFWMTTNNRVLPRPQTTNSAEIDVLESYGNNIYSWEIHVNTRDPNGNNRTSSPAFVYNPGALSQYGQFYSVWVNTDTIHFYVESATWDGKPAGDIHEVFNCPFVSDGMSQPFYLMVDYALQDRSFTGVQWTNPTPMWVKSFQVFTPN